MKRLNGLFVKSLFVKNERPQSLLTLETILININRLLLLLLIITITKIINSKASLTVNGWEIPQLHIILLDLII